MIKKEKSEKEVEILKKAQQLVSDYPTFYKLFLFVCFIPIIIIFAYWVGDNYFVLIHGTSIDGAFSFFGAVLTFIGTVSLGGVTLLQNLMFKKENDVIQKKLAYIEVRRENQDILSNCLNLVDNMNNIFLVYEEFLHNGLYDISDLKIFLTKQFTIITRTIDLIQLYGTEIQKSIDLVEFTKFPYTHLPKDTVKFLISKEQENEYLSFCITLMRFTESELFLYSSNDSQTINILTLTKSNFKKHETLSTNFINELKVSLDRRTEFSN